MSTKPVGDLDSFLRRQPAAALADVLLELAKENETVQARLERLQLADRPPKLAAGFRKTLNAWRRSRTFLSYREASAFGRMLMAWQDQIMRELTPKDPAAALSLFESLIESDAILIERADDSDGNIGYALRTACLHWLQTAAKCESPRSDWPGRLMQLLGDNGYGVRDELLRRADLLLDLPGLRTLVAQYESDMAHTLASAPDDGHLPSEVFKLSAALSLLSQALGDPDVKVRAVLSYSPQPNPVQKQQFVDAYLAANRPTDALTWLQGPWGHMETSRLGLEAEALGCLGRYAESAPIRQKLFEQSLSVFDLQRWLDHLPEASRHEAQERARQLAHKHNNPITAAALLLELGEPLAAESVLLAAPERIDGQYYGTLQPLAKALDTHQRWRGETAIYRALLTAILARGYAKAYGHGARYWAHLAELAAKASDLSPLAPHHAFAEVIRSQHARKAAFWAHVNGQRQNAFSEDE